MALLQYFDKGQGQSVSYPKTLCNMYFASVKSCMSFVRNLNALLARVLYYGNSQTDISPVVEAMILKLYIF